MAVATGQRLRLTETDYFTGFARQRTGLLKSFDERSVLTERRRIIIGDFSGAKRPQNFLSNNQEQTAEKRRHGMSRLRRAESKLLFLRGIFEDFASFANTLSTKYNPFQQRRAAIRLSKTT
ncbi:MAG TPA: hypothetical protein V6C81_20870 [Planktothrix sp.]